MAQKRHF
jgi:hypothetical protein